MENSKAHILKFQPKKNDVLSDEEIMKIFGGLIRLIQRSAEYSAFDKFKTQTKYYREKLEEATKELNKRNKQLAEVLAINENLIKEKEGVK